MNGYISIAALLWCLAWLGGVALIVWVGWISIEVKVNGELTDETNRELYEIKSRIYALELKEKGKRK